MSLTGESFVFKFTKKLRNISYSLTSLADRRVKHRYNLINQLKGTVNVILLHAKMAMPVVNLALASLHGELLETTLTVPLIQ